MIHPWLEDTWNLFAARLEQDRMPHALLLSGPPGIGKAALGEAMAGGLLCLEGRPEACGECRSCRLLAGGAHPDRFRVTPEEGKREISVKQIRDLIGRLALTTTISPRKVAVLHPAETMNRSAANALLKNLEEPPGDTVLLLISDDPSRLPVTVLSRCQSVPVSAPDEAAAMDWLTTQAGLGPESARAALAASGKGPLEAVELARGDAPAYFQTLHDDLEALIAKPSRAGALSVKLEALEDALVWSWLSRAAARALRGALGAEETRWPDSEHALPADKLAALQAKADRHRALVASSVRQDLLLKEWLLEWARLPARERIR